MRNDVDEVVIYLLKEMRNLEEIVGKRSSTNIYDFINDDLDICTALEKIESQMNMLTQKDDEISEVENHAKGVKDEFVKVEDILSKETDKENYAFTIFESVHE